MEHSQIVDEPINNIDILAESGNDPADWSCVEEAHWRRNDIV